MSESTGGGSFTLTEVAKDAWGAVVAGWLAYAASLVVLLALWFLSCCGVMCALVPLAMLIGAGQGEPAGAPRSPVLVGAIYVGFFVVAVSMLAVYEGVTLELTHAHGRGEKPSYRAAVDATLRRMPALIGAVIARAMIDGIPAALLACIVGAGVAIATPGDGGEAGRQWLAMGITLTYFLALAWWVGVRGWTGLVLSCVTRDRLGPRESLERSITLLRTRRAHFVGFRLVCFMFGLAIYCGSFTPLVVLAAAAPDALDRLPDRAAGALMLPFLFLVYVLVLALHALDTILVAAYHGRLAKPVDANALAKIFD